MQHHRGSRWLAIGLVTIMVGLDIYEVLSRSHGAAGITSFLLVLWSFAMILFWLLRFIFGRGRRFGAIMVLSIYLLGLALFSFTPRPLGWLRVHYIWPLRAPTFERFRADFLAHDRLESLCWHSARDFRVNTWRFSWRFDTQEAYTSDDRAPALMGAGLTEAEFQTLVQEMERMDVTCVDRQSSGDLELIIWGWLDNECGYLYSQGPSPKPNFTTEGTSVTPLSDDWYEFCT